MKSSGRRRAMCEWDDFGSSSARIREMLAHNQSGVLSPFHLLSEPGMDSFDQRASSELWIRDRLAASREERAELDFDFDFLPRDKIRIGYLSADFQEHATSLLLIETIEAHDRARFETFAYSSGPDDGKPMRRRLELGFDRFRDVSRMTDRQAACAIFRDGIDILIDLKGYTLGARTGILLLHPAPVQVNFLGYPGTLGGDMCDYIVTDRFITPPERAADYSEFFAYMPNSYQPRGRAPLAARPTRDAAGLPAEGMVFCCFHQPYKITPDVFAAWCHLLHLVPDSVLWLLESRAASGNLRNEALRHGIDARRLIFAPDMEQEAHLGRLQLADIMLDTSPCGAHTTASDALWAGVPVVTCPGETFASRVAGSVLHAAGLSELIAPDLDAYVDLAFALATNPDRLADLRVRLALARAHSPLFDVARYTADLEQLYGLMWSRRAAGLPGQQIS